MAQFTRSTASALDDDGRRGVAWTTTSLPRQGRNLGHAETGGEVVLIANNDGFLPDGSSVDFLFGVGIGNGVDGTDFSGNVFCNGAPCAPILNDMTTLGPLNSNSNIEIGQVRDNIVRISLSEPDRPGHV